MNVTNELFQAVQRPAGAKAAPQNPRDGGESAFEKLLSQRSEQRGGPGKDPAEKPLDKDGAPAEPALLQQQLAAALLSGAAASVQVQTPAVPTPAVQTQTIPARPEAQNQQTGLVETGAQQPLQAQTQTAALPGAAPGQPRQPEAAEALPWESGQALKTQTGGAAQADPQSPSAQDAAQTQRTPAAANTQNSGGDAGGTKDFRYAGDGRAPASEKERGMTAAGASQPQPLFRDVEAAPVKVGEPPMLDTKAPDLDAQLARELESQLADGTQKVRIRLSPENLGTVVVDMTRGQDGSLQVVLHTTTEKAAALLSEHSSSLGALLQGNTQANVQVEVQRQSESQQNQQQQQQDQDQQRRGQNPDQQDRRQNRARSEDFMHQLRLGLVSFEELVS